MKDLINNLDKKLAENIEGYNKLHEKLDQYRGKKLTEDNLSEVNSILKEIQSKFSSEIYPAINFIAQRHQFAIKCANEYNTFIETIKKAGAEEENKK